MKKWAYSFLLGMLLMACAPTGPELPDPPDNLLSFDEMVALVADLQFEQALYDKRYVQRNFLEPIVEERYYAVFEAHGVTEDDFLANYTYYKEDPEQLLAIYEKVLEDLSLRMGELRAKRSKGIGSGEEDPDAEPASEE